MIQTWGVTDIGLHRKENQDTYAIAQMPSGHTVCVVCDGMGGSAGGRQASRMASETFMKAIGEVLRADMTPQQVREAASYAGSAANAAVWHAAQESVAYHSMGTTLVAAVVNEEGAVLLNAGDSRAYHICEDQIHRVTKDHSFVESMVEQGDITEEEARRHPNRNLITRALGPDASVLFDGYICPMAAGDYLLLCSDGLVITVSDQEMLFEVIHGGETDTCLARLLEISRKNGAPDNVTAVLIKKQ